MNTEEIRSVGIDIGTTTTSMVLSLLRIENVAKGFGVPSVRIVDKRVIFRSDVMFTPFSGEGAIDGERIEAFLSRQFGLCSVRPADIRTGAVIVTGQAAHAGNARAIAQAVSRFSGSFVVATAGAHLWFWARLAYLPLYLAGVPVLRSLAWSFALAGLVMMVAALLV